jgi:hypothetical protein
LVLISVIVVIAVAATAYLAFASEPPVGPSEAERQQYEAEAGIQIQAWRDKLDELKVLADARGEADINGGITALEERVARAEEKLDQLSRASGGLWLEIQAEFEELRFDLGRAFAGFQTRLLATS